MNISGKVALVTGASSGIGRRQSQVMAAAGAKVILLARREEGLDEVRDSITERGGHAACLAADLLDKLSSMAEISNQATVIFGGVDILINAAGLNYREDVDAITPDSWRRTIDLNLTVPFFLAREFIPGMREKGWGRIVNLASLQSSRAFQGGLAYGASKGGIAQLTRAMAQA